MAAFGALSRLRMETSRVESAHERVGIANSQAMLPWIAHRPQLMVRLLGLIQPTKHLIQDRVEGGMVIERCHGSSSSISSRRYWWSSVKILISGNGIKAGIYETRSRPRLPVPYLRLLISRRSHRRHLILATFLPFIVHSFRNGRCMLLRTSLHLTKFGLQLS